MVEGIIQKALAGFYYVKTVDGLIECRARGILRKKKISPLVGDKVVLSIDEIDESKGMIDDILTRKVELIRPAIANVDQAVIVFAHKNPNPNINLLDKLLLLCEYSGIDAIICLNKDDLDDGHIYEDFLDIYQNTGYKVMRSSAKIEDGIDELKSTLKDKISVFAGPSGVGKSTLLNTIKPGLKLKTGEISEKIQRGKHTTRHTELVELDFGGFVADTPGFTSLNIEFIDETEISDYFPEIRRYANDCKFRDCMHMDEPGCEVAKKLDEGLIHFSRYNSYKYFINQIRNTRRKKYD